MIPRSKVADRHTNISNAVLVLGLLSVLVVTWVANASINARQLLRFESAAGDLIDKLHYKIEIYPAVLRSTRAVIETANELTPQFFQKYVGSLEIRERYLGMQAIGYSLKSNPQSQSESFPIRFIEPLDERNRAALGYDMFSEPVRREAMERARDSGKYAISGRLELKQEIDSNKQPGFIMYMPMYGMAATTLGSVEERRNRLTGFLHAPFRTHDFFSNALAEDFDRYVISIFDGEINQSTLLFDSQSAGKGITCSSCPSLVRQLHIGGRSWTIRIGMLTPFKESEKWVMYALCLGQLILVGIIWSLARSQGNAYRRVELATHEKERLLASERAARSEVEKAIRMKDEFLATVSHELRSPLNAILGWAQLINRPSVPPDHTAKGLETIERNVRIQARLIEDLLDMSRITSGKLKLEPRPVDIRSIFNAALETVKPAMENKRLSVTLDLRHKEAVIVGDAGRLQQVVWNILSNAVKFSTTNGKIHVGTYVDKGTLCITVRDDGAGIAPEFLPFIFDRFRQADAAITRKHGGLGLGLAISKHIVELHGGSIHVESEGVGKGAQFTVCLPLDAATGSAQNDELRIKNQLISAESVLSGCSVLIVDDEPDAREVLQRILEEVGMSVVAASSVDDALNLLEHRTFSMIVSDLGMPEKDGFEFARIVRLHRDPGIRNLPMIALSALARSEDRARATDSGFSAHVSKPLDARVLTAVMAQVLV